MDARTVASASDEWEYTPLFDGLAVRQHEYHPTHPDLMLMGTVNGLVMVGDHQADYILGYSTECAKSTHDPVLALCWFHSHPDRFLTGSGAGKMSVCSVQDFPSADETLATGAAAAATTPAGDPAQARAAWAWTAYSRMDNPAQEGGEPAAPAPAKPAYSDVFLDSWRIAPVLHPADHDALTSVHVNSDDTRFLASGYGQDIDFFDATTGSKVRTLASVHKQHINIVRFANTTPHLAASSSFDGTVKLWDLRLPGSRPAFTIVSATANVLLTFSPDDTRLLVSGVDNTVAQYDVATGSLTTDFAVQRQGRPSVFTRSYYMNGGDVVLTASSYERVARMFDASTGECRATLDLHPGRPTHTQYVQSLRADPHRQWNATFLLAHSDPCHSYSMLRVRPAPGLDGPTQLATVQADSLLRCLAAANDEPRAEYSLALDGVSAGPKLQVPPGYTRLLDVPYCADAAVAVSIAARNRLFEQLKASFSADDLQQGAKATEAGEDSASHSSDGDAALEVDDSSSDSDSSREGAEGEHLLGTDAGADAPKPPPPSLLHRLSSMTSVGHADIALQPHEPWQGGVGSHAAAGDFLDVTPTQTLPASCGKHILQLPHGAILCVQLAEAAAGQAGEQPGPPRRAVPGPADIQVALRDSPVPPVRAHFPLLRARSPFFKELLSPEVVAAVWGGASATALAPATTPLLLLDPTVVGPPCVLTTALLHMYTDTLPMPRLAVGVVLAWLADGACVVPSSAPLAATEPYRPPLPPHIPQWGPVATYARQQGLLSGMPAPPAPGSDHAPPSALGVDPYHLNILAVAMTDENGKAALAADSAPGTRQVADPEPVQSDDEDARGLLAQGAATTCELRVTGIPQGLPGFHEAFAPPTASNPEPTSEWQAALDFLQREQEEESEVQGPAGPGYLYGAGFGGQHLLHNMPTKQQHCTPAESEEHALLDPACMPQLPASRAAPTVQVLGRQALVRCRALLGTAWAVTQAASVFHMPYLASQLEARLVTELNGFNAVPLALLAARVRSLPLWHAAVRQLATLPAAASIGWAVEATAERLQDTFPVLAVGVRWASVPAIPLRTVAGSIAPGLPPLSHQAPLSALLGAVRSAAADVLIGCTLPPPRDTSMDVGRLASGEPWVLPRKLFPTPLPAEATLLCTPLPHDPLATQHAFAFEPMPMPQLFIADRLPNVRQLARCLPLATVPDTIATALPGFGTAPSEVQRAFSSLLGILLDESECPAEPRQQALPWRLASALAAKAISSEPGQLPRWPQAQALLIAPALALHVGGEGSQHRNHSNLTPVLYDVRTRTFRPVNCTGAISPTLAHTNIAPLAIAPDTPHPNGGYLAAVPPSEVCSALGSAPALASRMGHAGSPAPFEAIDATLDVDGSGSMLGHRFVVQFGFSGRQRGGQVWILDTAVMQWVQVQPRVPPLTMSRLTGIVPSQQVDYPSTAKWQGASMTLVSVNKRPPLPAFGPTSGTATGAGHAPSGQGRDEWGSDSTIVFYGGFAERRVILDSLRVLDVRTTLRRFRDGSEDVTHTAAWVRPNVYGDDPGPVVDHTATFMPHMDGSADGHHLVVFGGYSHTIHNAVHCLCIPAGGVHSQDVWEWKRVASLGTTPQPRYGHTASATRKGTIVIVGGQTRHGPCQSVLTLHLAAMHRPGTQRYDITGVWNQVATLGIPQTLRDPGSPFMSRKEQVGTDLRPGQPAEHEQVNPETGVPMCARSMHAAIAVSPLVLRCPEWFAAYSAVFGDDLGGMSKLGRSVPDAELPLVSDMDPCGEAFGPMSQVMKWQDSVLDHVSAALGDGWREAHAQRAWERGSQLVIFGGISTRATQIQTQGVEADGNVYEIALTRRSRWVPTLLQAFVGAISSEAGARSAPRLAESMLAFADAAVAGALPESSQFWADSRALALVKEAWRDMQPAEEAALSRLPFQHGMVFAPRVSVANSAGLAGDEQLASLLPSSKRLEDMQALLDSAVDTGDVVLALADGRLPAHSWMLAATSSYFALMFSETYGEDLSGVLALDCEVAVGRPLLSFIYTGQVPFHDMDPALTFDLMHMASVLNLPRLTRQCETAIAAYLDVENCLGILQRADMLHCGGLRAAAMAVVLRNFAQLSTSEDWLQLPQALQEALQDEFSLTKHAYSVDRLLGPASSSGAAHEG